MIAALVISTVVFGILIIVYSSRRGDDVEMD